MSKNIIQILAITLFFFIIGFVLTYPYELSYSGNENVVVMEDSYEETSLEGLTDREEFKGKVLYIRIWEPFDSETRRFSVIESPTEEELDMLRSQVDSLNKSLQSYQYSIILSSEMNYAGIARAVPVREQIDALEYDYMKYNSREVAFISVADPDNESGSRKDDIRKWKRALKEYDIPGYHMIMNPELIELISSKYRDEVSGFSFLPYYFIADKEGNIVNYQAPWPQDTLSLFSEIDNLLAN